MKRAPLFSALFAAAVAVTAIAVHQSTADATLVTETQPTQLTQQATFEASEIPEAWEHAMSCDVEAKRCSTSSDCPNSKCRKGKCGGCSTSSDCRYGKCKSSQCGGCSTSSDCGGWGKCKSGRCGGCSTSSDCGSFGSCRSGRCQKTPY